MNSTEVAEILKTTADVLAAAKRQQRNAARRARYTKVGQARIVTGYAEDGSPIYAKEA